MSIASSYNFADDNILSAFATTLLVLIINSSVADSIFHLDFIVRFEEEGRDSVI